MKIKKELLMKRKYFLMATALLLLVTSCGPKRYGCSRRRCIVESPSGQKMNDNHNKMAAYWQPFIFIFQTSA